MFEEGGRKNADMLADRRGSARVGFAVGHHEICDFLTRLEIENQPSQPRGLLVLVCSRAPFDQTDDIVALGGNLREPEMSGRVGSGRAEVGCQPFFRPELSQRFVCAVSQSAWRYGAFSGGRVFCR